MKPQPKKGRRKKRENYPPRKKSLRTKRKGKKSKTEGKEMKKTRRLRGLLCFLQAPTNMYKKERNEGKALESRMGIMITWALHIIW